MFQLKCGGWTDGQTEGQRLILKYRYRSDFRPFDCNTSEILNRILPVLFQPFYQFECVNFTLRTENFK